MPVLTVKEADTLGALRALASDHPDGAPVWLIRADVYSLGVRYDDTFRALKGLVAKGLVTRPRRGVYKAVA